MSYYIGAAIVLLVVLYVLYQIAWHRGFYAGYEDSWLFQARQREKEVRRDRADKATRT